MRKLRPVKRTLNKGSKRMERMYYKPPFWYKILEKFSSPLDQQLLSVYGGVNGEMKDVIKKAK